MKNKLTAESYSSFFVSTIALIIWFGASIGANLLGFNALAVFLMFIFLTCLVSRIWGNMAIRNVSVALDAQSVRLFQGNTTELTYTVTNNKFMPLIWLEVIQKLPKSKCLWPENEYDVYEIDRKEESFLPKELVSKKKFTFVLWYQTLSWTTVWEARRRGIYHIDKLRLVSGDGLGLAQKQSVRRPESQPAFVVYPRIQPVNIEMFLRTISNYLTGSKGYMDDQSVIKGSREYQLTDSWKHINWRMAAREHKLQVNMFETVLPKSAHFIIDGESFQELSPEFDELEEAISIIASIMLRLRNENMECGLSLPRSDGTLPINIFPSRGGGIDEVLYYLSGYQCIERSKNPEDLYKKAVNQPSLHSEFDEQSMFFNENGLGKVYYVVHEVAKIKHWVLLERLGRTNVTLLTYKEPDYQAPEAGSNTDAENTNNVTATAMVDYRIVNIHSLKKE